MVQTPIETTMEIERNFHTHAYRCTTMFNVYLQIVVVEVKLLMGLPKYCISSIKIVYYIKINATFDINCCRENIEIM